MFKLVIEEYMKNPTIFMPCLTPAAHVKESVHHSMTDVTSTD